jgi:hypothetical protein
MPWFDPLKPIAHRAMNVIVLEFGFKSRAA